jgi:alpha-1,2-mannosyltransferase
MTGSARSKLTVVALICGLYGTFCAIIYAINLSKQPGQDWMVYYTAARAYLDGNLPLTFDGVRFTAQMNAYFADRLTYPLTFHPWVYPPTFLLLLIPFGLFPFEVSYGLFQIATLAGLFAAVWYYVGRGYRRWLHTLSLIFAPAVSFNIGTGQNAFLTSALLIGGFGLLPRRPLLAGALIGLITYKPQFWLMAPIALVASQEWRALVGALITAAGLVVVSAAVFGIEPWLVWIEWMTNAPPDQYQEWLKWGRSHGESIYTNLAVLGASHAVANLGQLVAMLLAGASVWWCYHRAVPGELQFGVLLAATVLAAPHVTNYDTVLLVVAATLLFARGLDTGFRRGELIVPVLVWMIQLFNPPRAFRIGLLTPVLTGLLILCTMLRVRTDPVVSTALQGDDSAPSVAR